MPILVSPPRRNVQLVVFDLAGTTVEDPDGVGRALKGALDAAKVPYTQAAVNAVMGTPKPVAIATLLSEFRMNGGDPDPAEVDAIYADFRARMLAYYRESDEVRAVPGAEDVFRQLRAAGIKVGVDTGFAREIIDAIFVRLNWGPDLIDASLGSDEVANGRPHPDLVYGLMDRVGVNDPAKVAKVGDTPSDLGEGSEAGCGWVIGVTEGTHSEAELAQHPHTHLVPNVTHVPALLGVGVAVS